MNKKRNVLDLNDSDSEGEGFNKLSINKNYAERYDRWRGGEELQKLKDRYGDLDEDEEESSTSEEEWTEDKEKEFFKTFSLLKKKDPKIYDSNVRFFRADETQPNAGEKKKGKEEKAFLLKDHERKMLLEKGAEYGEEEEDVKVEPSYVEEQANIKKGFSDALKSIDTDDEGDDYMENDLLKKRKKTVKEAEVDEDDYRQWLKGEVDKIKKGGVGDELKYLKEYWNDPNLNEDERFLRDYILNRKYRETEDANYIPSYDEVVHDSDEEGLSGDEQNLQKMEEFEHKYNFRFEEPDQDFIKRYPRTVETSLRRGDDKRKRQRDAAKERKEAELEKKREEIQRLKALKRNEILEKIKQLESIAGENNLAFDDKDIEGDFDPEAHDRKMQQIFNDQYYGQEEEEKPVFSSDEELDEEWKAYCPSEEEDSDEQNTTKVTKKISTKQDKSEANLDEQLESPVPGPSKKTSVVDELIEASKGKKGKKKKTSVFLEALERAKPKFNTNTHHSYEKYFDEYYQLDFEDLIGDLPCRFKYRKVTPNNFGLSVDEILKAPDRELNQWASLKKTYQHRTPEEENYDLQAYEKKAGSRKKQKILQSLYKVEEDEDESAEDTAPPPMAENGRKKKKKNKKKKKKPKGDDASVEASELKPAVNASEEVSEVKKSKKKKNVITDPVPNISSEHAPESEEPKKKKKRKSKNVEPDKLSLDLVTTEESTTKSMDTSKVEQLDSKEENGLRSASAKKRKQDNKQSEGTKAKNRKGRGNKNFGNNLAVDDDRLRAYGINPTKYKKQLKYGNKN